jgi:hypothetical protein
MRVHIDGELVAECSHLLPERWNGWACPVFTAEQRDHVIGECVRLGWDEEEDGVKAHLDGWEDLGNDEWAVSGWVWEVAE